MMGAEISDVIVHILNFIESILIISFPVRMLGLKKEEKRNYIIFCVTCIGLTLINEIGFYYNWDDLPLMAIHFLILLLGSLFILNGKIWTKFFWCFIAELLVPVINICCMQIILILSGLSFEEFADVQNVFYILSIVMVRIFYWFCSSGIVHISKRKTLMFSNGYGIVWFVILVYSLIMESFLMRLIRQGHIESNVAILGFALGIFVFDAYFLITIHNIQAKRTKDEQISLLRLQLESQQKHIDEMQRAERQIQRMQHDYKNHLQNFHALLDKQQYEEAKHYIQELETHYLSETRESLHTGNATVDAVINTRAAACHEENIPLYCTVIGNLRDVDGFRMATILFNLLDNAIEASEKEKHPEIYLEIVQREKEVYISIKNRIGESVLQKNPNLQTSKHNTKKHGIGLMHVREIMEEVQGIFNIEEKEGFFCAECMIPIRNK